MEMWLDHCRFRPTMSGAMDQSLATDPYFRRRRFSYRILLPLALMLHQMLERQHLYEASRLDK
jgi:hypothetical protein